MLLSIIVVDDYILSSAAQRLTKKLQSLPSVTTYGKSVKCAQIQAVVCTELLVHRDSRCVRHTTDLCG